MVTINVKLQPFPVPNEVSVILPSSGLRQDGIRPNPTLKLTELSDEALGGMIEEFAANVMAAARPE